MKLLLRIAVVIFSLIGIWVGLGLWFGMDPFIHPVLTLVVSVITLMIATTLSVLNYIAFFMKD